MAMMSSREFARNNWMIYGIWFNFIWTPALGHMLLLTSANIQLSEFC